MDSLISVLLFGLGIVSASFVGVVGSRYATGQSTVRGRSHCDACGADLPPASLIPVFSYLFQNGRASCCGARISLIGPLSEVFLGFLFVALYIQEGLVLALPLMLLALSTLLFLVVYDLWHQILPPAPLWVFVICAAAARLLLSESALEFVFAVLVAFLLAFSLALLHFASAGRLIGFADAPLAFGLALFAGGAAFSGFVFSFWIGALGGIIVLFMRPKGSRMGIEVPFAPYLSAGFLFAYLTQWNPFDLIAALLS